MFEPKGKAVTVGSRELHNRESNFYFSDVDEIKAVEKGKPCIMDGRDKKYV